MRFSLFFSIKGSNIKPTISFFPFFLFAIFFVPLHESPIMCQILYWASSETPFSSWEGEHRVIGRVVRGWSERSHEVMVLCMSSAGSPHLLTCHHSPPCLMEGKARLRMKNGTSLRGKLRRMQQVQRDPFHTDEKWREHPSTWTWWLGWDWGKWQMSRETWLVWGLAWRTL